MLPDRVLNPGPLTYQSGALPIALRGPASAVVKRVHCISVTPSYLDQCSLYFHAGKLKKKTTETFPFHTVI